MLLIRVRNKKRRSAHRDIAVLVSLMLCIAFGRYVKSAGLTGTDDVMDVMSESASKSESPMADENAMAKKIAITFDDGPNADYTETLLAGLKERGVKATFFLLGKEIVKYPEIVKNIHDDGHLIGTHSYDHVNLNNLSDKAAVEQVDMTNAAIHEITGEYPEYIRPPFGCWKCNLDYETKMIEVLWDVDPLDWKTSNSDVIAKRVTSSVEENSIILLHDASESSVNAAFKIIDELTEEGYVFVTVDEILFD